MQLLKKTVWKFLKKQNNDSTVPLLDIYEKKIKILIQENMCTSMFFAPLFTMDKNMKPKWQSIDRENVGKYIYIYTLHFILIFTMAYHLTIKRMIS